MSFRSRLVLTGATLLLSAALVSPPSLAGDAAKVDGNKNAVNPASSDADLMLPKISSMNNVDPVYPAAEKKANVEGMVLVRVMVKADGTVGEVGVAKAVEGHPAFSTAALTAVQKWSFAPGQRDGKPVDVEVVIPVQFKLEDKERGH